MLSRSRPARSSCPPVRRRDKRPHAGARRRHRLAERSGSIDLAVIKGAPKVEQAAGCASRDLPAGASRPAAGQVPPAEPGGNRRSSWPTSPISRAAGAPRGEAAIGAGLRLVRRRGVPNGFGRQDVPGRPVGPFPPGSAGHGGADWRRCRQVDGRRRQGHAHDHLHPRAGLQHRLVRRHHDVAVITKGPRASSKAATASARRSRSTTPARPGPTKPHRHLGNDEGNETGGDTSLGFNMNHGEPMPVFGSDADHLDFTHPPRRSARRGPVSQDSSSSDRAH